ncbi:MAG: hypothetical protein C0434_08505 [Xanthomonadaceae bacterium]|nr:hypothetical protein [Xanthomonadaceae bacterium]
MQSQATTVSNYLAELPDDRRSALDRLRASCLAALPDAVESMDYGMPSYRRHGQIEIAFASQKQYIALYLMKPAVLAANKAALKGLSVGKACVRFASPERMDFALIERLLAESRDSPDLPC